MPTPKHAYLAILMVFAFVLGTTQSSYAVNILQYSEDGNVAAQPFAAVVNSGHTETTFLTASGNPGSTAISVIINLPTIDLYNIHAWMNVYGFQSNGAAASFFGSDFQYFYGKITFTANADGTGSDYLTAVFDNTYGNGGTYNTVDGTTTGTFQASQASTSVVLTSDVIHGLAHMHQDVALSLSGINPPSGIIGSTINGFVANSTGTFSSDVAGTPEPATLGGAGLAVAFAVCVFRRNRIKAAA